MVSIILLWAPIIMAISAIIVLYMAYHNCRRVNFLADLAIRRVEISRASRLESRSSCLIDSLFKSQLKQKL